MLFEIVSVQKLFSGSTASHKYFFDWFQLIFPLHTHLLSFPNPLVKGNTLIVYFEDFLVVNLFGYLLIIGTCIFVIVIFLLREYVALPF